MKSGISTRVFLHQRLHQGHLDALLQAGAQTVELYAARHHFDYTDRNAIRELATWFRSNQMRATLHQPLFDPSGSNWSKHHEPSINLIDVEKSRRISAMDEVKRALETAEQIDIDSMMLHLGIASDTWSERSLDHSLTAIEHIKAFAHPLGVKTLVETLNNPVSTPEHLAEILRVGHFSTVHVGLDLGHAHLEGANGIRNAFDILGPRIVEVHVHDNHGMRDEHLWPGEGSIDWKSTQELLSTLKADPLCMLEPQYNTEMTLAQFSQRAKEAIAFLNA